MKVNPGLGMSCTRTCFSEGSRRVKNSSCTCQKLEGVATWLCQSVANVFFASLEWCSCFNVDTNDGYDGDSTTCATPLILNAAKEDSASSRILKHARLNEHVSI
uniref:Uncharacterized protein n=1 Tax=Cajanus cajan TaxID=3821 RepID=A0A151SEK4_CAJCA|nr:hypothetical protein KK1_024943 [Cajanus cajan]